MNKITVFIEFLKDFNTLTIFIRLMLAAGAGACIGIDREFKNRGCGIENSCSGMFRIGFGYGCGAIY